jgi:hypothetical protein
LLSVGDENGAGRRIKADCRVVVPDALDGRSRDGVVANVCVRGDLARKHHEIILDERFGGDARGLVLL